MEKRRCNIRDLAKAAGLSAGTVSRILNNRPGDMKIPEATRLRVVEIARRMQYVPNIHAKRLFSRSSGVIGLVVPTVERNGGPVFGNSHLSHILAGMEEHLNASSRTLELVICNRHFVENRSYISMFQDGSIDGLLIYGAYEDELFYQQLVDARFPYVFIDGYPRLASWVNSVMNDHAYAAGVLTEQMLRAGHRNVLFLEDMPGRSTAWHHAYGIRAALDNQKLPPECVTISGEFPENARDFTAVVTTSYRQAERFRKSGLAIGCCSVFPGEAAAWPELARVESDDTALGLEAVRAVEKIIDAEDPFLVHHAIKGRLIEGSTIYKV